MSDSHESTLQLLVQTLRHIQNASYVLAECLARFSEELTRGQERQMDRLYGVAYLFDLVGLSVETARLTLKNEITAR